MADTIIKRWNGSAWIEDYPKTTHTQIVASGTPSSTTFLRGDGTWATPAGVDNYVNTSGDTMTGAISMTSAVAHPGNSTPTALAYGKLTGYGTFFVNADTDQTTTEYLYLTAGYGQGAGASNEGMRIGYAENSLTWKGHRIFTDNYHPNADTLTTARTINVGTGASGTATSFNGSANITIPINSVSESYLSWGGQNTNGYVTPIGMSLSNEHSANRLAFINGNSLYFEYSSDGGSTWTDYGYSASTKSQFCTTSVGVPIGRTSGNYTINSRTRITLTAQDGTNTYVYTNPRKMLLEISSSGGMQVLVETRTGANYQSSGAWSTFGTYTLSGWSGWNDIPLVLGTLGGGTTQTGNNWQLRLTFIMTSVNPTYPTTAQVNKLRIFGENTWYMPSTLAGTNDMYTYDMSQNVFFPATIQGTRLISTVATGTSPLSVTSTTAVTNLNADLLDGNHSSAFATAVHTHNELSRRDSITYGLSALQWADISGTGGTGLNGAQINNPTNEWWHHLIMNHGNAAGYYVDLATAFHSDDIYFRRNVAGSLQSWRKVWNEGNDGTGSGLDADLLDGQHGSYYAPIASPALTGTPTAPTATAGTNTTQIATTAFVSTAVANLINAAPGALDTLDELAAALGDDANFASTVTNALAGKASTVHTHTKSDITDFGHNHGNITNTGTITSLTVTPGDQDRILIADNSASGSIERGIIIGTGTTTFLRNDGTWATPAGSGSGTVTSVSGTGTVSGITLTGTVTSSGDLTLGGTLSAAISNISGLQTALDGKLGTGAKAADSNLLDGYDETAFVRLAANSSSPTNGTFAIGTSAGRNFIQSHSGQPLDINPLGNAVTIGGTSNTAWHAGNDGVSSGLDADLLDGQQGTYYQPASSAITTSNIGSQSVNYATSAGSASDSTKLPLAGGTITLSSGTTSNGIYFNTAQTYLGPRLRGSGTNLQRTYYTDSFTIWDAGNDGAGSGLDADLLDGIQSSSFVQTTGTQTINGQKTFGSSVYAPDGLVGTPGIAFGNDTNTGFYRSTADQIRVALNGVERMVLREGSTSVGAITINTPATSGSYAMEFRYNGVSNSGEITVSSSNTTSYVTSSDYRLKTDVVDMDGPSALARIMKVKPREFTWLSDGKRTEGFIAHELQEEFPDAVIGIKDAVIDIGNILDADGKIVNENFDYYEGIEKKLNEENQTWVKTGTRNVNQGTDTSFMVAALVKAIQEQQKQIEDLKLKL